jgi:hypothetical protein
MTQDLIFVNGEGARTAVVALHEPRHPKVGDGVGAFVAGIENAAVIELFQRFRRIDGRNVRREFVG